MSVLLKEGGLGSYIRQLVYLGFPALQDENLAQRMLRLFLRSWIMDSECTVINIVAFGGKIITFKPVLS